MAALVRLVTVTKRSGRPYEVFAGLRTSSRASGAVLLQNRKYSLETEQASSQADMPVEMASPYEEPLKKCTLCGVTLDYKNVQLLSQFISPYTGRILGMRVTGLCEKKQFELGKMIKRARYAVDLLLLIEFLLTVHCPLLYCIHSGREDNAIPKT